MPGDALVATMLANLHARKDHETLLRAWKIVTDRPQADRPGSVLVLAGRPAGTEGRLEALACELGLTSSLRFAGRVADVSGLLAASDLGVLSSRSEGLPNGALECMAAGLPVAATDVSGVRDAVGLAGARHLAAAGDAVSLAGKITAFLDDPALRRPAARRTADASTPSIVPRPCARP